MGIFDGFLTQVGTSLVNNALSQYNARKQRDWQEKMMDKQNAYNSPIQDKIRKLAAGVNPYAGELNSIPSASSGTGATAQTFPLQDPLATAFTMAQIRNMDAQTGKTETETEKVLREIANLEQLYQKGIIEKEEMEYRFNELKKAWKETSQYKADLDNTQSETNLNEQQAKESEERTNKAQSDRLYTEALTETENALRNVRVNLAKAQTAAANASAQASVAQASKLMLEGKTIEMQNVRDALRNSAMLFYGFDPTTLPNELSATLMNNFAAVVESDWNDSTAKDAMDKCHELLKTYRDKAIWTPTSTSYGWNNSVSLGKFSISSGQSSSNSN